MFCMKCGKPTEGEQTICAECATAAEQPTAEETFQLNTPETPAPSAPKKKTGLIVGIVAGVLALAVVLAIVFSSVNLEATFSDPNDYMISVEEEAITDYADVVTDAYGTFLDTLATATAQEGNSGTMDLHILLGDEILTLLESQLTANGVALELDWANNILLSANTIADGNKTQYDLGIGFGEKKVLTLSFCLDAETSTLYIGIPELSATFLTVDMAATTGMNLQEAMAESTQMMNQLQASLPAEEDMEELIVKYLRLLLAAITDVEKSSGTVTVGNVEQKATVLTTTITEKQMLYMLKDVLEAAKVDEKLISIIEKFVNSIEGVPEEVSTSIADEFRQAIDEQLAQFEEYVAQADDSNYLKLVTYVNKDGEVIGRTLSTNTAETGTVEIFRHATARSGDDFAFEAVFTAKEQSFAITGNGTEKKDIVNASYVLVLNDETYLTLQVIDLNSAKAEEGNFDGTLRLIPSTALLEQVTSGTNLPVSMLGSFAIELTLNRNDTTAKLALRFLANDNTLLGFTLDSAITGAKSVALPEETIEVEDQYDLLSWLSEVNFETLLNNMKEAGVPEELISMLEMYVG